MLPDKSIDLEQLEEIRSHMRERFDEIVTCYIHDAERFIADIRHSIEQQDAKAAYFAAHALKSSSLQFGIIRLAGLAKKIEGDTRATSEEKQPCDWGKQLQHLGMAQEEFGAVRQMLE